jgi:hypothetical protein
MALIVGLGLSALLSYAHARFHDWWTMALVLFFVAGGVIGAALTAPPSRWAAPPTGRAWSRQ